MKKRAIVQYRHGAFLELKDAVAEESLLHIELSPGLSFDTIVSPRHIREFVYGNLLTEGFISSADEITGYQEKRKGGRIYAVIKLKNLEKRRLLLRRNYNIIWTECGSGAETKRVGDVFRKIRPTLRLNPEDLLGIQKAMRMHEELFRKTGAYHYAFLFDPQLRMKAFDYDIGRHNAVDKVVGHAFLKNENLEERILFITGRVTSDIVLKCLRARIPQVISKSAPLDNAVSLARKYGLGLVGFLRGERFNIYSGEAIFREE